MTSTALEKQDYNGNHSVRCPKCGQGIIPQWRRAHACFMKYLNELDDKIADMCSAEHIKNVRRNYSLLGF
jgi:hypothetical protein